MKYFAFLPIRALAFFVFALFSLVSLSALVACDDPSAPPDAPTLRVTPTTLTVAIGTRAKLVAESVDAGSTQGTSIPAGSGLVWTSSDPAIAKVETDTDGAARVTGMKQGSVMITATLADQSASAAVTVTSAKLTSIGVTPTQPTLAPGITKQLVATGTFSDQTTADISTQVTWSTSDKNVALVDKQGLVAALDAGTSAISATLDGKTGSTIVTVSGASLLSIAITPSNPSIANGTNRQLTATGTFSDASALDISSQVTWTSSDPTVATVSATGLAMGASAGTSAITAAFKGTSGTTTLTVTGATLSSIAVTPTNPSLAKGTNKQLTATGSFSDATTQDLSSQVVWTSSDTNVATVSASGSASGVNAGTATIAAKLSGITGQTTLTVSAAQLVSIAVTPATPSIANGTSLTFTATGTYSDTTTQDLTAQVAWSASDGTVATVSNAAGSKGLATGVSTGTSTIGATLGGKTGSTTLTVTGAALASIAVTPASPSLAKGTTQQFVATGTYSDATTQNLTATVAWSSSDVNVGTVSNAAGTQGVGQAVNAGAATITASLGGKTGATTLTVTAARLASIAVTPANPSIVRGTTQPFIATGTYTDTTTQDLSSSVTWVSSDTNVASISNAAGSRGVATGAGQGAATITATVGAVSGGATLTVTVAELLSIAVTPTNPSAARGTTRQLTATGTYSDASTQDLTNAVTWSSSDTNVATLSNAAGSQGLASAANLGASTITATLGAVGGTTTMTVTVATVASISVTPGSPQLARGTTQQLTATATFTDNSTQNLTTAAAWSSSDADVAVVSSAAGSEGLATAVNVGSATVSATFGGKTGSTSVAVTAATLASIAITPTNPSIARGTARQFTATGTYTDNSTQDVTAAVTWSSSDTLVASVSNAAGSQGLATAANVGAATINATLGGRSGSTTLTVTAARLVSIAVTPTNPTISNGTARQFTATGTYTDNSTQNLTTSVTWASSDTNVGVVSNAAGSEGLATGAGAGATTIRATLGAVSGSTTLTVTVATLVSIDVTPTSASISLGSTRQFTATGRYTDNSTQDLTATATWASADMGVATLSNAAGSRGFATSTGIGVTTVSATQGSITGLTQLTVSSAQLLSIAITPANPSIARGTTEQFIATGTYSDSTTQNLTTQVTWASSNTSVAAVSSAGGSEGLATGVNVGSATISATTGSITGTTTLTVTAVQLVSIAITPANPSLARGLTRQLTATGTYSDATTQDITTAVTWASANTNVATVSNAAGSQGLATTGNVGGATVSASLGPVTGTTTLTVTSAVLVSIAVTPANPSIAKGRTQQFVATGTYTDSTTQDLSTGVTWASSDTSVAPVSNAAGSRGLATGVGLGTTTISATLGSINGGTTLTVTAAQLVSVAITPLNITVMQQQRVQLKATATFTDATTSDVTSSAAWSSSDTNVVTVGTGGTNNGRIDALATASTATITAIVGSLSGSTSVTVSNVTCHITINEVQAGATGNAANEWVELYNSCTGSVDVSTWTLVYRAAATTGATDTSTLQSLAGSMNAGDYRLYSSASASAAITAIANGTWALGGTNGVLQGASAGIGLRSGPVSTGALVDSVAYGSVTAGHPFIEGTTAPGLVNDRSIIRSPYNGRDSNTGGTDFVLTTSTTPRATNFP